MRQIILLLSFLLSAFSSPQKEKDSAAYTSFATTADKVRMYWKKDNSIIGNFKKLKAIEPKLVFAMNAGMFTPEYAPVGLYVENGKQITKLRKMNNPNVNFGLQPQAVFLIRNNKAEVIPVEKYNRDNVSYATQSAPMLVIDSKMNPQLPIGKKYIRNGVGILPDGRILMAVSKTSVSFHEFAQYFIANKCSSAMYLDGAISQAYNGTEETSGSFGVMIGVVK